MKFIFADLKTLLFSLFSPLRSHPGFSRGLHSPDHSVLQGWPTFSGQGRRGRPFEGLPISVTTPRRCRRATKAAATPKHTCRVLVTAYGHRHLQFMQFSCVAKFYFPQPFKNVKTVLNVKTTDKHQVVRQIWPSDQCGDSCLKGLQTVSVPSPPRRIARFPISHSLHHISSGQKESQMGCAKGKQLRDGEPDKGGKMDRRISGQEPNHTEKSGKRQRSPEKSAGRRRVCSRRGAVTTVIHMGKN